MLHFTLFGVTVLVVLPGLDPLQWWDSLDSAGLPSLADAVQQQPVVQLEQILLDAPKHFCSL